MESKIIFASAGTGKTTAIVQHISQLSDDKILCITYTKAAAKEIKDRCPLVNSDTIHGFIFNILMGFDDSFTSGTFLGEKNSFYIDDIPNDILKDILNFISIEKFKKLTEEISDERILKATGNYEDILGKTCSQDVMNFHKILLKTLHNLIDYRQNTLKIFFYDDLIIRFYQLLKGDRRQELLFYIFQNVKHIIIDEFQDTTPLQCDIILDIILEISIYNRYTYMIVGDLKQQIFGFQGSNIEYINKTINDIIALSKYFQHPHQVLHFNTSHRLPKEIVKHLNSILPNMIDNYPIHSTSSEKDGEVICYKATSLQTINEKSMIIVRHVEDLLKRYDSKDICLLFRRRSRLMHRVYRDCQQHNIVCQSIDRVSLVSISSLKFLYYICRLTVYPDHLQYWCELLSMVSNKVVVVIDNKPSIKSSGFEVLHDIITTLASYDGSAYNVVLKALSYGYISQRIQMNHMGYIPHFLNKLMGYGNLKMKNIIHNLENMIIEDIGNGINLKTIHSSKGLEYKCVLICDYNNPIKIPPVIVYQDNHPMVKSYLDIKPTESDDMKVLYVALTRSKEVLGIFNFLS